MGLDAAVEHKARPDDRSLKQQAAANGRKPDAELLDHMTPQVVGRIPGKPLRNRCRPHHVGMLAVNPAVA
jgi:hypothetical protein